MLNAYRYLKVLERVEARTQMLLLARSHTSNLQLSESNTKFLDKQINIHFTMPNYNRSYQVYSNFQQKHPKMHSRFSESINSFLRLKISNSLHTKTRGFPPRTTTLPFPSPPPCRHQNNKIKKSFI